MTAFARNALLIAVGGAITFVVVRELIDSLDNSSWSTAEVTMWETVVPLVIAVLVVMALFGGLSGGGPRA